MGKNATEHNVDIAEPYCAREGWINFYLDIANCYKAYKREGGTHVGFFTHMIDWKDPDWLKKLDDDIEWSKLDGIITMTKHHAAKLREHGYNGLIKQIVPGNFTHSFQMSPLKLLIVQRGTDAHYGQDFVLDLLDSLKPDVYLNLEFMIVGDGWEPTVMRMRQLGIGVEHWKDSELSTKYPESYQQCYDWCDFVFIPIHETGGPMCYLEAQACGKPVITADVGWVKDGLVSGVSDYVFAPGAKNELTLILRDIISIRKARRDEVKSFSWDKFSIETVKFIAEVDNNDKAD